jgi:hypothetical protein
MVATGAVTEAPTRSAEEAPAAAQRTGASATGGERVTFESQGETIVGRLFPPGIGLGPAPAAVIIGPENYQKEQAPAQ